MSHSFSLISFLIHNTSDTNCLEDVLAVILSATAIADFVLQNSLFRFGTVCLH